MSEKKTPDLIVYTTTEDGYFVRIGAAWKNSKNGFGIRLNANPLNGELVLLPPKQAVDIEN